MHIRVMQRTSGRRRRREDSDDYEPKLNLWTRGCSMNERCEKDIARYERTRRALEALPLGVQPKFRPFKSKKFSSYEEMNAWKLELLEEWISDGCPTVEVPNP
jgi:hypothetical protein